MPEPAEAQLSTPLTLALVSAGGVLGALTRYGAGVTLPFTSLEITWAINVSGCFLMGVLMTAIARFQPRRGYLRPFLGVGFLGGYTTFSTATVDVQTAPAATALPYLALTVAGSLVAVWLGRRLVEAKR